MPAPVNPFLDAARIRHEFYGQPSRLAQRTGALRAAKTAGRPVADVIAEQAADAATGTVLDVGCGRGSTTAHLARAWVPRLLVDLDQSHALLAEAHRRVGTEARARFVCADFHALPLPAGSVDLTVAAFCLYHSTTPERVIGEFACCLRPGGRAILVTKSADSYRALDHLVAAAELDPRALSRPSLYESFHSGNAAAIAATHLTVARVQHDEQQFQFTTAEHLVRYLTTSPKYEFPPSCTEQDIAARLRRVLGSGGLSTSSIVSYVVAERP